MISGTLPRVKIFREHDGTDLILFYRVQIRSDRGSARHLKTENLLRIQNGYHPRPMHQYSGHQHSENVTNMRL